MPGMRKVGQETRGNERRLVRAILGGASPAEAIASIGLPVDYDWKSAMVSPAAIELVQMRCREAQSFAREKATWLEILGNVKLRLQEAVSIPLGSDEKIEVREQLVACKLALETCGKATPGLLVDRAKAEDTRATLASSVLGVGESKAVLEHDALEVEREVREVKESINRVAAMFEKEVH